jgi:chitodextrinase
VSATDSANNTQTQELVISVAPQPPLTVSLSASTLTPTTGQIVVFTASASAGTGTGVTILRYEWTLGDGSTQSTTGNTVSHSYGSAGQKLVKVTAIGSDESQGLAQIVVTVS